VEGAVSFLLMLALIIGLAFLYTFLYSVARWLNDTNLTVTFTRRKVMLQRRIEDAKFKLGEIARREQRTGKYSHGKKGEAETGED